MARRKAKPKYDKKLIIEAFADMAREKSIDKDLLQGMLVETLSLLIRKKYGQEANFDIVVNMDKGDLEIYLMRTIVEEVEDPSLQISLKEVSTRSQEIYELGDENYDPLYLNF